MKYILFGAGERAKKIISTLYSTSYKLLFVVDNDLKKQDRRICGFQIKSPQCLRTFDFYDCHIWIAVSDREAYNQIVEQLMEMGFIPHKDFSDGLTFFLLSGTERPGRVSGYCKVDSLFETTKTFDPSSMLVKIHNENRIFRMVKKFTEEYKSVYRMCRENNLFGNYIVNTYIVPNKWGLPCDILLEHEFINHISYVFEWSPRMFADYVKFMIRFIRRLAECGLRLLDGHTLNATIYRNEFIYIDFGALGMGTTRRSTLMEFMNTHILPLTLMAAGQFDKAYMYLKNPGLWLDWADVVGYLDEKSRNKLYLIYESLVFTVTNDSILNFTDEIADYIYGLPSVHAQTMWLNYQDDEWDWDENYELWSAKMKNVEMLIQKIKPSTVIDLAANMGWYGTHLYNQVNSVICLDNDYGCIDNLWDRIKNMNITNVLPIYMNICSPTLDYYRDDAIGRSGIKPWRKNAMYRFTSELAIALAIVHHLAFRQQLTFREIIEQFSLFTSRYLLVEFIQQEDIFIKDFKKDGFEWYTEKNFLLELMNNYEILDSYPSTPKKTRTLYLCEKRNTIRENQ